MCVCVCRKEINKKGKEDHSKRNKQRKERVMGKDKVYAIMDNTFREEMGKEGYEVGR